MSGNENTHDPAQGAAGWGWEPVPQGGEYDSDATAFVSLPPDMLTGTGTGEPLAAPGHGYVPPVIVPVTSAASTDPGATGTWTLPAGDPVSWPVAAAPAPEEPGEHDPGATAEWHFAEAVVPAPDHALTGEWSVPVAEGDLPEESGEYARTALRPEWAHQAPATLPGGAPAPWAEALAAETAREEAAAADLAADAEGGQHHPAPAGFDGVRGYVAPPADYTGTVRLPAEEPAPAADAYLTGSFTDLAAEALGTAPAPAPAEDPAAGHPEPYPDYPAADPYAAPAPAPASYGPGSTLGQGFQIAAELAAIPAAGGESGSFDAFGNGPAPHDGHGAGAPEAPAPAGPAAHEGHPADDAPAGADAAVYAGGSGEGDEADPHGGGAAYDGFGAVGAEPAHADHAGDFAGARPADPDGTGADGGFAATGAAEGHATEGAGAAHDAGFEAAGAEPAHADHAGDFAGARPADPHGAAGEAAGHEDHGTGAGHDAGFGSAAAGAADGHGTDGAGAALADPQGSPAEEPGHTAGDGTDGHGTAYGTAAAGSAEDAVADPHEEHPYASYVLRVNGADRPVTGAWIGESLLYVLRERLGLAGAKDGCSQGECGACAVQVDGRLVASCLVPAATAAGSEVRTVEGLATDGELSDVQQALCRSGAVQCGFCVPGMAMTIHDLLEGNHAPSELETRQALCGNLCRCSGYRGVLEAVREVVAEREAAAGDPADGADPAPGLRVPHQAPPGAGGVQHHPEHHHGGMGGMA
ncbi:hypothetical protein LG634_20880 [Streptomyces bambusae]|uniref:2Fe-2S iron-sulfur cluster-binding protein n=1 Tax=Streptomyces bambusae TaxID=1550616 RepID=UPI001CFE5584|nr:2Fe-2S iron-sulfur cluster-binding protein [Streptomyces bambusae]MCB5167285.1 hypothetical protein [Streptomyces bambusae]